MKTVGKQLQEARQAKEWSPELAARETKIKIERLRDLEADDFSNFSSPTYARGFVRTYARALGIDEYKLLRQLDNKLPEDDNASFANDTGIPYMPEQSQISKPYKAGAGVYVAMGVGSIVILLIAYILFQTYRAGYFASTAPSATPAPVTNVATAVPDTETTQRALPADSNAPPVALPVDSGTLAAAPADTNAAPSAPLRALPVDPAALANGTNVAPAVSVAPSATNNVPDVSVTANAINTPDVTVTAAPATPTTPLDTKTPPRAQPVDLSALTPADVPVTNASVAETPVVVAAETPTTADVPVVKVTKLPPALSARQADARRADRHEVVSAPSDIPTPKSVTPLMIPATTATPETSVASAPVSTIPASVPLASTQSTAPAADGGPAVFTEETPTAPAPSSDSGMTGEAPNAAPAAKAVHAGKHLTLTASHDSYIRVVSLDDPNGEHVLFSSVLRSGHSISFPDRKYSINVGLPYAVDIALDGINYGPHSDHSAPDTFTVESHQP